ncbi:MAG: hypothetical protein HFJ50_06030 [Clostridia bacterium]|nr:hypothetical protein [Clostridia bacterium]
MLVIIAIYYINSTKEIYEASEEVNSAEQNQINTFNDEEEEKIVIHITGAVKNEGIVFVKENARINDVIEAAGGLIEDSDIENVNLAYAVEDGQKIYIPYKQDMEEKLNSDEIIINEAGENVIQNEEGNGKETLININKADNSKLQELPGIRKLNSRKNNYI